MKNKSKKGLDKKAIKKLKSITKDKQNQTIKK